MNAIPSLAALALSYLFFAFVQWETDPSGWPIDVRVLCASFGVLGAVYASAFVRGEESRSQRRN